MTVHTIKSGDKNEDGEKLPSPEVVSDTVLLLDTNKLDHSKIQPSVVVSKKDPKLEEIARRNRLGTLRICAACLILPFAVVLLCGLILLYKHLNHSKPEINYYGRCGVDFHQMENMKKNFDFPLNGFFEQEVELTEDTEKIKVPSIGRTTSSITYIDFKENFTTIADTINGLCFIMPLNRTIFKPPRDFWDILINLMDHQRAMPSRLSIESYKVVTPELSHEELEEFGVMAKTACSDYKSFRLVKKDVMVEEANKPRVMSKRAACPFSNLNYCEGASPTGVLYCLSIDECI